MRDSHRHLLVEAALELLYSEGPESVTQNAVAERAGLTRQGLLYHFRRMSSLAEALHERVALGLDERVKAQGSEADDEASRTRQFAAACADHRTFAELQLLQRDGFATADSLAWREKLISRAPCRTQEDGDLPPPGLLIACLAAEGLLVHEALHGIRLSDSERQRIVEMITTFSTNLGEAA